MSVEVLKNRLSQPIPEKCPLSEALVWLITECPPISIDDSNLINTPNLEFIAYGPDEYSLNQNYDNDWPESGYYAYNISGAKVLVDNNALNSAKNKILIALKKGNIKAYGNYGDFNIQDAEEYSGANFTLSSVWDNYYDKNFADSLFAAGNNEIPSELWAPELIDWLQNALHSPLKQENLSQFSDVIISTDELFKEFAKPEFLNRLHPVERYLIPLSEAASLMTTGEHNSDNSATQDILARKSAELVRALRNGKLYSEGRHKNGDIRPIENTSWMNNSSVSYNQTSYFTQVVVDENEIRAVFNIPKIEKRGKEDTPASSKRGRPPLVEKEIWLTELAVLFKSGLISQSDNLEVIAQALIDALKDNHKKTISLDTVRKDWLRPIFSEAKRRNGDK